MSSDDRRPDRLRRLTREALQRYGRGREEVAARSGDPPRQGDVFAFAATADLEHPVLWAVIGQDPEDSELFEVVAADHHPLVGSADVAVPADSACGALTLRCGFSLSLDAEDFRRAKRVGSFAGEILRDVRAKRAAIRAPASHGSILERETDEEWEVRYDLRRRLRKARSLLSRSLGLESDADAIHPLVIEAVAGQWVKQAVALSVVAAWARKSRIDEGDLRFLRQVHRVASEESLGLPEGIDAADLSQTGWAVVFSAGEAAEVQEALRPLVEHRRKQAGEAMVRVLEYRPGDGWRRFLARYGVAAGDVQPAKVPYHLLLVGSPSKIPWDVQLMLSAEYAVGRLSFETPQEYRSYARSVVAVETSAAPQQKSAVFFTPRHASDPAACRFADRIVKPLVEGEPGSEPGLGSSRGFATVELWAEDATKDRLGAIFLGRRGTKPPALLFAATRGLARPPGDPQRRASQGALLCQLAAAADRPDPSRDFYGAADFPDKARVAGTIAFLASSYGAGTQDREPLSRDPEKPAAEITEEPFVAGLPQRLLAAGALAVIGLTARSWGPGEGLLPPLRRTLDRVLAGAPVGHAVQEIKKRQAELSIRLTNLRNKIQWGGAVEETALVAVWSEWSETRSYVVLGDPAVRLRVDEMD